MYQKMEYKWHVPMPLIVAFSKNRQQSYHGMTPCEVYDDMLAHHYQPKMLSRKGDLTLIGVDRTGQRYLIDAGRGVKHV